MNARADRFPLFDALRALAALSVLTYHVSYGGFNGLHPPWRDLASHLDVGVTIFFVISGFLLYRPFVLARLRGDPMPRAGAYAWRRFLRIVPAYWVALTVVALWLGYSYVFTPTGILTYYGFAQSHSSADSVRGIGQAWTLGVEICFYALLPLWALALRRIARAARGRQLASEAIGLVLLVTVSVGYQLWVSHVITPQTPLAYTKWLPAFLDQFAIGMALAVASAAYQTAERTRRMPRVLRQVSSGGWVLAAVMYWALCIKVGRGSLETTARDPLLHHSLYSLVGLGVVAPAVLFPAGRGFAGRVLRSRALLLLGLWSYGIYLYHVAVVTKLVSPMLDLLPSGAVWRNVGLWIPTFAGSVALAAASYYLVERPALSFKRRFPLQTPAASGEAIAEPAPAAPPAGRQV
jgi:peptidoglycan/LPS O-acetylase OafA/YrhL